MLLPRPPMMIEGCPVTFDDEFIGSTLNTQRWNVKYSSGRSELQYYAPDAFSLSGGVLRITAEPRPQHGYPYTSGIITTQGRFAQQYGFFEIRAKVPAGQGLWPAFWLLHTGPTPWTEIDIFEVLGHQPNKVYLSNHWPDAALQLQSASYPYIGPDFSDGFHTFALDWEPGLLTWYVDGQPRAQTTHNVPAEPMFLLANLAVGGNWPGKPNASTHFPAYLDIDYIRAFALGCQPTSIIPTPLPESTPALDGQ